MKKLLTLFSLCFLTVAAMAQTTNRINYQAIARNASGAPLPNNSPISLRFSILEGSGTGAVIYKETQAATTNAMGLFTHNIGDGQIAGTFDYNTINWTSKKFLKVEMDPAGGLNFQQLSNEELKAVPFANAARSLVLPIDQTASGFPFVIRSTSGDGIIGTTTSKTNTGVVGYTETDGGNGTAGVATKADGRAGFFWNTAASTKVFLGQKEFCGYFEHPSGTWAKFGLQSPAAASFNGGMDIYNGYYNLFGGQGEFYSVSSGGGNLGLELHANFPYIDFAKDKATDFNMRLALGAPNILELAGGQLYVSGNKIQNYSNYGYLAQNGPGSGTGSSGDQPVSIVAGGRILAAEFGAVSDKRIKKIVGVSDANKDFEMLQKLEVTDYTHIDVVAKGSASKKGFIAQQVETVFPEAVSLSKDFIPNVYTMSQKCTYDATAKTLQVTMATTNDLKVGDKVRLILEKEQKEVQIGSVSGNSFTVQDWTDAKTEKVFVYGKEVSDFHTVDYDRIFTLNVSATQALIQKNADLEKRVADLEAKNNNLQKDMQSIEGKVGAILKTLDEKNNTATASTAQTLITNTQK